MDTVGVGPITAHQAVADLQTVGTGVMRKDVWDQVTGRAVFTTDVMLPGMLYGHLVTATTAHARILSLDIAAALRVPGVRTVVTGDAFPKPVGPLVADRPPLAHGKVRYCGEPVAVVVANCPAAARQGAGLVTITYDPLPVVNSPGAALAEEAPLVHEDMATHKPQVTGMYPRHGTNIGNHTRIRKGNVEQALSDADVVIKAEFSFPTSDHAALEQRCAIVSIGPDGTVTVWSASQSTYIIEKMLSHFFSIDAGKIVVHTPTVGGGFGGKGSVQLEFIAYLAAQAVGGRPVRVANTREQETVSSPAHIGLEAQIKLGATNDGRITGAEFNYWFDGGAYTDMGSGISKSAACDCTGPYRIDHVSCDSYMMYTNHPYTTSFRGFGHGELTFVIERAMDLLAEKLGIDPIALRHKNAIAPADSSPTGTIITPGNCGDTAGCLAALKKLMDWERGRRWELPDGRVRARGMATLWKTSSTPKNAGSGAVLTFNRDGSVNVSCGVSELGQGTRTAIAQIVAESLKMDVNHVHVAPDVDTRRDPEHWKTVASSSLFMSGRAAVAACADAIEQLRRLAAVALRCAPEELDVGGGRVYLRSNPKVFIDVRNVCMGFKYPDGSAIGGQVIGRGSYVARHLSVLNPQTGAGASGPWWTVGAQGVEVLMDPRDGSYQIEQAWAVMDAGIIVNPALAKGQVTGGMSIGLSWASREGFLYTDDGQVQNHNWRHYKLLRYGEHPKYTVEFVQTPQGDGPFGARGIGEYGVVGAPAALASALSAAAGIQMHRLPLTPETIWTEIRKGARATVKL